MATVDREVFKQESEASPLSDEATVTAAWHACLLRFGIDTPTSDIHQLSENPKYRCYCSRQAYACSLCTQSTIGHICLSLHTISETNQAGATSFAIPVRCTQCLADVLSSTHDVCLAATAERCRCYSDTNALPPSCANAAAHLANQHKQRAHR